MGEAYQPTSTYGHVGQSGYNSLPLIETSYDSRKGHGKAAPSTDGHGTDTVKKKKRRKGVRSDYGTSSKALRESTLPKRRKEGVPRRAEDSTQTDQEVLLQASLQSIGQKGL